MPTIHCVKDSVNVAGINYPLYIGFLAADDIASIATAPSFQRSTAHRILASEVLSPPMKDWQRPIDPDRVDNIRITFNGNELMPNPVLLAENAFLSDRQMFVSRPILASGVISDSWAIRIEVGLSGEKPLWILDGQHRIAGLSSSTQRSNPVPVVLLLNDATTSYTPQILAKIFAQVTTSATKLDDLHNEWLTYAFGLDDYLLRNPDHQAHSDAMRTVAELCNQGSFNVAGVNIPNPFLNHIRFNNYLSVGGFAFDYTCIDLKNLLFKNYFRRPPSNNVGHIQPIELAAEIAMAHQALVTQVTGVQAHSVFFGDADHKQRIMQDAFIVGVLSRLLNVPRPIDWGNLLHALRFTATAWNYTSWKVSLNGPSQTASRDLALRVFASVFKVGSLPQGANTITDYLRGNFSQVKISFSMVSPTGRILPTNRLERIVVRGATTGDTISPRTHVKIVTASENIARLRVVDRQSPPGRPKIYTEIVGRGIILTNDFSNPLQLDIRMEHYAGTESSVEFDVTW